MKEKFIQSVAWAHTWLGLVFSWLLFGILLTGAITVFRTEINIWAMPEFLAPADVEHSDRVQSSQKAIDYLQKTAPDALDWYITLPSEREPFLRLEATERDGKYFQYQMNPNTGQLVTRPIKAGDFFYYYHSQLLMSHNKAHPNMFGLFLVGAAGIAMMVACISGVIIHKRIFKDYFTFRPSSSRQRSWTDAHNIFGVLALPFHFILAYTGLIILFWLYMPPAINVLYQGDNGAFHRDIYGDFPASDASAPSAQLLPIVPLLEKAESYIGIGTTHYIEVRNPGRADSIVEFWRTTSDKVSIRANKFRLSGTTGEILPTPKPELHPAVRAYSFASALHFVTWGGPLIRWVYFLCGIAGAATTAFGLVIFTVKRQKKSVNQRLFYRIIHSLNIAATAGFSVACVAYMLAQRLLPLSVDGSQRVTEKIFLAVWFLTLLHAALQAPRKAWTQQVAACMILCIAVPFTGVLVDQSLFRTLAAGDWVRAGVDLTALGIGILMGCGLWLLHRRSDRPLVQARQPIIAA